MLRVFEPIRRVGWFENLWGHWEFGMTWGQRNVTPWGWPRLLGYWYCCRVPRFRPTVSVGICQLSDGNAGYSVIGTVVGPCLVGEYYFSSRFKRDRWWHVSLQRCMSPTSHPQGRTGGGGAEGFEVDSFACRPSKLSENPNPRMDAACLQFSVSGSKLFSIYILLSFYNFFFKFPFWHGVPTGRNCQVTDSHRRDFKVFQLSSRIKYIPKNKCRINTTTRNRPKKPLQRMIIHNPSNKCHTNHCTMPQPPLVYRLSPSPAACPPHHSPVKIPMRPSNGISPEVPPWSVPVSKIRSDPRVPKRCSGFVSVKLSYPPFLVICIIYVVFLRISMLS